MLKFIIVGSGSKGNATLIYTENSLIQIDMGLPLKRMNASLDFIGSTISDIEALFITHEHSDHIKGLELYHDRVPLYAGEGTLNDAKYSYLIPFEPIFIGDFEILPLPTSHDVVNPFGFLIKSGGTKLVYMTDTGIIKDECLPYMKDADYYILESNHDMEMLMNSGRPKILIDRIKSDKGHLSNEQSATYLTSLIGPHTKQIVLAHPSEECNSQEKAFETHRRIYKENGLSIDDYEMSYAPQWTSLIGGDK